MRTCRIARVQAGHSIALTVSTQPFGMPEASARSSPFALRRINEVANGSCFWPSIERAARAVSLRDQGRLEEARALLSQNAREIDAYVASNPSAPLADMAKQYNGMLMMMAKPGEWNAQRKMMRQMDSLGFESNGSRSRY